ALLPTVGSEAEEGTGRHFRRLNTLDQPAIAQAEKHLPLVHDRGTPHREIGRVPPENLARLAIETKGLWFLIGATDPGPGEDAAVGHRGTGVNVEGFVEVPALGAGGGVEAVEAVIARTEKHGAGRDARARFQVIPGLEIPPLGAAGRIE